MTADLANPIHVIRIAQVPTLKLESGSPLKFRIIEVEI